MNTFSSGICIGTIFGTILMGLFILVGASPLDSKVGNQKSKGIVYTVSIDSNATDSVFGKEWRYKK
jgi:hypothetical protein